MALPQLSVAQRLWLGLIMLLSLFAAADLVSFRAARDVDETLDELIRGSDERRGAGYEMRADLSIIVERVHAYLQDSDERKRGMVTEAQQSFEDALRQYTETVLEQTGRDLAIELRDGYALLSRNIDEVFKLKAMASAQQASWPALQHEVEGLLAAGLAPMATGRDGASPATGTSRKDVERALRELGVLLHPGQNLVTLEHLARQQAQFGVLVAQNRKLAERQVGGAWLDAAERWHIRAGNSLVAYVAAVKRQERSVKRLNGGHMALDALLANSVQPAARADLAAAVERASRIAHDANNVVTRSLILALLLGVPIALATVRAVRAPLRKVVASSHELAAGDFSKRVRWNRSDELGELAKAFNDMAERLQSTTVSRAYLEGVVNSLSEALFVVSERGIVQTANPAARHLLGYEEDEFVGLAIHRFANESDRWLLALQGEEIIEHPTMLESKDGAKVPVLLSAVRLVMQGGAAPAFVCIAQDLRQRIAAERHRRQTVVVFENTREALILTDNALRLTLVNPAFHRITGYADSESHGRHVLELLIDSRDARVNELRQAISTAGQWQGEVELRRKDKSACAVWLNVSAVYDAADVVNYVFLLSDISEMKEVERRLHELAHYDALTYLPNRRLFLERGRLALDRAQRSQLSVALLYLDLDDFKDVNDTFGHAEGDRLLTEMSERLLGCLRSTDTLARLGGDEFVVILEDVEDQLEPSHVAQKLLAAISSPYRLGDIELRPRASVGISLGPSHGATVEELLKASDAAMYRAKRRGGAAFEFFSPELTNQAMEKLQLQHALRHPDLLSQLVVHYQPQLDLRSGVIVSAEALVRWNPPDGELLLPGRFIKAAEEAGLVSAIGEWVLRTACKDAVAWQSSRQGRPLRVAVNVSALQIKDERIVKAVRLALEETGLDPALLELEVTEDALQIGDEAERVLQQLKRLDVRLALDDFGSGYSSLGSLKALPFDRLKIDRTFLRDVQNDSDARSIVHGIISMAHTLKLGVLAEGVETQEQFAFLCDSKCDEAQGYLIGRPVSAEQLQAQVARRPSMNTANRRLSVVTGRQK